MTTQTYYSIEIENLNIVEMIEREAGVKIPSRGDPALINCPLPDHNDQNPSFAIYRRTNSWYCYGCNRGGNVFTFLKHFHDFSVRDTFYFLKKNYNLKIDTEKERQIKISFVPLIPLPDDIKDWLYSRKLKEETISRFKLMALKDEGTGKRFLGIPLFNERGEVINWKIRRDHINEDETLPKYKFLLPQNKVNVFPLSLIDLDKEEIFVCEGELDAILLCQEGYNVITSTTGGNSIAKNEELINIVKKFKKVYLLPDNDDTGKKWSFELKERLSKLPIEIVEIKLPDGIKDVTELYQNDRTLQDIMKDATVFKSFLAIDEIMSYQDSEVDGDLEFFGHKGIIFKGSACLIGGYPKIGKTELTIRFACELAKNGLTVYYLSEEDNNTWRRRLLKMPSFYSNLEVKKNLKIRPLAYFGINGIKELIEFGGFDVLIVDTLRSSVGTDLKDEKEAQEIIKSVLPIVETAKRRSITLVFIHHQTKTTDTSIRAVAGSHALAGIVDVILCIFPVDENNSKQRRIEITGRVIEPKVLFYEMDENNEIKFVNVAKRDELTNLLIEMKPKFVDRQYKTEEIEQYVNEEANRRGIKFTQRELREKLHKLYEWGEYDREPKERSRGAKYSWRAKIEDQENESNLKNEINTADLTNNEETLSALDLPY
jgi:5S rRNA maturation endonuclease (ribonuclease M5)/archaellum biogenesis ATPase FlaH